MKRGKRDGLSFLRKTRLFRSLLAGRCCFFSLCLRPPLPLLLIFPRCFRPGEGRSSFSPTRQRGAGAKAIPDARRADGAPEQARTSPAPKGREGSRRRPTRRAADGGLFAEKDTFRVPGLRGVGGCGGCRGVRPLSPPAPRRAGDPPPVPVNSSDSGNERPQNTKRRETLSACA